MGSAATHAPRKAGERMKSAAGLLILYLILIAGLGVAGYHYYNAQQQRTEGDVRIQLLAIADLKVAQIAEWRRERIADGEFVQSDSATVPGIQRLLEGSRAGVPGPAIDGWIKALKSLPGYANVMLIDSRQAVVLSLVSGARLDAHWTTIVREAMRSSRVSMTDLHRESGSGAIYLTVIVPVVVSGRGAPIGVLGFVNK
jgi:hypothetical protein